MNYKFFWFLRAMIYKLLLGEFAIPSYLGKPLFISNYKRIFLEKKVRILPGARIEVIDKKSSIYIHEDTSIGQNFHIISGGSQKLTIGKNTTISGNVFITNVEHEFRNKDVHILEQELIYKTTIVNDNCFIGYGAVIQAGTILGIQCIVGSNSVVRGTFPDYSVIVGIPGRVIKRYDPETKLWKKTNSKGMFIDD